MPKKISDIDVNTLVIETTPLPTKRLFGAKKYQAIFSKLTPGQNIRCLPDQVGRISQALRKYIKDNELPDVCVISETNGKDGKGRVWMTKIKK